jgi:two-component system OmpR family response regulator
VLSRVEKRILILDGDPLARGDLGSLLGGYGLTTLGAGSAREMEQILRETQVNLVMLDMMLPDASGLSVCARLLSLPSPPAIMVVSDSGEECDVVVGLELGADDYVIKPYRPRELLARVKAVLRRHHHDEARADEPARDLAPAYRFDGWRLNVATQELFDPRGRPVPLSTAEFLVLWALVDRPGQVLTRDELRQGPPDAHARPAPQQVNVAISRLRSKLGRADGGAHLIRTVRHVGYIFAARVDRVQD